MSFKNRPVTRSVSNRRDLTESLNQQEMCRKRKFNHVTNSPAKRVQEVPSTPVLSEPDSTSESGRSGSELMNIVDNDSVSDVNAAVPNIIPVCDNISDSSVTEPNNIQVIVNDNLINLSQVMQLPCTYSGFSFISYPYYFKTKEFKRIVDHFESNASNETRKGFIISGPSGTGKSIALIAMLVHFLSSSVYLPVLISESKKPTQVFLMQKELLNLYEPQFHVTCCDSWVAFVNRLADVAVNRKILLLYDIPFSFSSDISLLFRRYSGVASLTSRQSKFKEDTDAIHSFKHSFGLEPIDFKIFTHEEVDLLVSLCKPGPMDVEELKSTTLCCPQLVMLNFVDTCQKLDGLSRLKITASMHILELETKILSHSRDLVLSTYFMRKIGEEISPEDKPLFFDSAVATLQILFLDGANEVITTTYIHVYSEIMAMLLKVDLKQVSISGLDVRFIEAVKGERLEHLFYDETKQLNFTLYSITSRSATKVTLEIMSKYVMGKGATLSEMNEDTLYLLPPCHPSIDAVIYSKNMVYLIQVSTTSYEKHHTKCDSVSLRYKGTNVLKFYLNVSKCEKAAYVYITTKLVPSRNVISNEAKCTVGVVTERSPLAIQIDMFKQKLETYLK